MTLATVTQEGRPAIDAQEARLIHLEATLRNARAALADLAAELGVLVLAVRDLADEVATLERVLHHDEKKGPDHASEK